tara:strand:- start:225 stop:446 length:222 start_codon:yes stop_codon:yes gene_type:complete
MSDKDIDKFAQALEVLKITDWKFEGADPTNETEFKARFRKIIGADDSGSAIYTDDANRFGVTWSQVKAEMDKL